MWYDQVCALLIYGNLVSEPEDAMQIFAVKRIPPNLRASEMRYLYYLHNIVQECSQLPHFKPVTLTSVSCSPVPRMTRARDGCRMFVEVSCNDKVILTTIQEYDKMRYVRKLILRRALNQIELEPVNRSELPFLVYLNQNPKTGFFFAPEQAPTIF